MCTGAHVEDWPQWHDTTVKLGMNFECKKLMMFHALTAVAAEESDVLSNGSSGSSRKTDWIGCEPMLCLRRLLPSITPLQI
jgi:hypothetical protein